MNRQKKEKKTAERGVGSGVGGVVSVETDEVRAGQREARPVLSSKGCHFEQLSTRV